MVPESQTSSGVIDVQLMDGPLSMPDLALLHVSGAGAVLSFQGIVRPMEGDAKILGLDYQAYEPMATKSLEIVAHQTLGRFGLLAVYARHSKGFVPSDACSFVLVVQAPHRKATIAAIDYFVDVMKKEVPIWKSPRVAEET